MAAICPDQEVAAVRDHADAMARFIVDLFLEQDLAPVKNDDIGAAR